MTSTVTYCIFPKKTPTKLDQDEIIEILDQAKARDAEWHEAMVYANIDTFENSYEESLSYFNHLENLENIRCTNGPNLSSLQKYNKKSVTSIVGKSSKNHKGYNMWCRYCDKNNHNTADCREIAKFKQQKKTRIALKPKLDLEKSLWPSCFLFEEINALKRQLKLKKTASSKKGYKEG
jgi:hypothetical protein